MRCVTAVCTLCLLGTALSGQGQAAPATPEAAPGLSLPAAGGVAALDTDSGGAPVVVTLHASEIAIDNHTGANVASSAFYGNRHRSIDLDGATATQILPTSPSALFVCLGQDNRELWRSEATVIRLKVVKDRRVAITFSNNYFGGSLKRIMDVVPIEKTDVPNSCWLKMTPAASLAPGEYAFVFLMKDPSFFPELIYDFSVAGAGEAKAGK